MKPFNKSIVGSIKLPEDEIKEITFGPKIDIPLTGKDIGNPDAERRYTVTDVSPTTITLNSTNPVSIVHGPVTVTPPAGSVFSSRLSDHKPDILRFRSAAGRVKDIIKLDGDGNLVFFDEAALREIAEKPIDNFNQAHITAIMICKILDRERENQKPQPVWGRKGIANLDIQVSTEPPPDSHRLMKDKNVYLHKSLYGATFSGVDFQVPEGMYLCIAEHGALTPLK